MSAIEKFTNNKTANLQQYLFIVRDCKSNINLIYKLVRNYGLQHFIEKLQLDLYNIKFSTDSLI